MTDGASLPGRPGGVALMSGLDEREDAMAMRLKGVEER